MTVSARQKEVLSIIGEFGADGWGEVWTFYDGESVIPGRAGLHFRNFDRVADALKKHQLVEVDADTGHISLTDAGRKAVLP